MSRRTAGLLFVALLTIQITVLAEFWSPAYYYGVDENGYFMPAESLAHGGAGSKTIADPLLFVGENMVETAPGKFYSKYPIGYPAALAAAERIGGSSAPFIVNPAMAVLTAVGAFWLALDLFGVIAALLTQAAVGFAPLTFYYGVRPMSHAADACLAVWCMLLAWRWYRYGKWGAAVGAGACLAAAIGVRYSEVILALPVVALMLLGFLRSRRSSPAAETSNAPSLPIADRTTRVPLRRWVMQSLTLIATAAIVLIPLLIYLTHAFGAPWRTGYSLTDESTAFTLSQFFTHLPHMLWVMNKPGFGMPVLFPLGLAAACWFAWKRTPAGILLALWIFPCLIVYTAYYWVPLGNDSLYTRFFDSCMPGIVIAAVGGGITLLRHVRTPSSHRLGMIALAVITIGVTVGDDLTDDVAHRLVEYANTSLGFAIVDTFAANNLPADATVIAARETAYFLDYSTTFDIVFPTMFTPAWVNRFTADPAPGEPRQLDPRRATELRALLGGKTSDQMYRVLRDDLRARLSRGQTVALLTDDEELATYRAILTPDFSLTQMAHHPELPWGIYRLALAPPH
jgi:hypothetical protein